MIKIHFINVGHGDCIVVEFCDTARTAVIDINMSDKMDDTSYAELITESINSLEPLDRMYHEITGYSDTELLEKAGYQINLQNTINYMSDNEISSVFRFISTFSRDYQYRT